MKPASAPAFSVLADAELLEREGRTHEFAIVESFDGAPRLFGTSSELGAALIMLDHALEGRLYRRSPCGRFSHVSNPSALSLSPREAGA